jgi:hypothetical protein
MIERQYNLVRVISLTFFDENILFLASSFPRGICTVYWKIFLPAGGGGGISADVFWRKHIKRGKCQRKRKKGNRKKEERGKVKGKRNGK